MVGGFSHAVQQQVPCNVVATTKAIIKIERSTRPVVKDVVVESGLSGDCLEPERRLFLPESNLVANVVGDDGTSWLLSATTVRAYLVTARDRDGFVCVKCLDGLD
jgi:hypothetical protein